MNDLFLPKEQKELADLISEKSKGDYLVFSCRNHIYGLENFDEDPFVIKRSGTDSVNALVCHDGRLLDAGESYTIRDSLTENIVLHWNYHTNCMLSHGGELYMGSMGGLYRLGETTNPWRDNTNAHVVGTRNDPVFSQTIHDDVHYFSMRDDNAENPPQFVLLKNHNSEVVLAGAGRPYYLCSHTPDGIGYPKMYCAVDRAIYLLAEHMSDAVDAGDVAEREDRVRGLFEHKGVLYDYSDQDVFDTLSGEIVFSLKNYTLSFSRDKQFTTFASVPKECLGVTDE